MTDTELILDACLDEAYSYMMDTDTFFNTDCDDVATYTLDMAYDIYNAANKYFTEHKDEKFNKAKFEKDLKNLLNDINAKREELKNGKDKNEEKIL